MTRWIVSGLLVAAAVLAPASAAAGKREAKVPPELEGIDPYAAEEREYWTRKTITVLERERTLGGTKVVVWKEEAQKRWKQATGDLSDGSESLDNTFLGVADVATKKILLYEAIASKYDLQYMERPRSKGSYKFTFAWEDLNGDGEPELVFTPKGKGKERILQVRFGGFEEVGRAVAACPRTGGAAAPLTRGPGEPADGSQRAAAKLALVGALDGGEAAVRCAIWEYAFLGRADAGELWPPPPMDGSPILIEPAGASRSIYYRSTRDWPHKITVEGREISEEALEIADVFPPDPDDVSQGGWSTAIDRFEALWVDGTAWGLLELTHTLGKKKVRNVALVDLAKGRSAAAVVTLVDGTTQRGYTFADGDGDGVPELSVTANKKKKGEAAVVWRWDRAAKSWRSEP